jgi:hypothetical protein
MLKTAKQNPCFDHNLYGSRINGKFSSCPLRQETYPGPLLRLEHRASGAIISLENLSWLRTLTSNAKKVTKVDKITPSAHWKPSHQATRDSIASPCAQITADLGHSKATRLLDATDAKIIMLENVPHFEEHVRRYLSDHLGPCLQNCRSAGRGSRYTVDSLNYCRLGPFESQLAATHDVQGDATVTASTTV